MGGRRGVRMGGRGGVMVGGIRERLGFMRVRGEI